MRNLTAPPLETARLKLRGHRKEDFPKLLAMWGKEAVNTYITGKVPTEDEVWARVQKYAGHWVLMGVGFWVVEEKSSGKFVGEVGFGIGMTKTIPQVLGQTEVGWIVDPPFQGKGYATEAVQAILKWAEETKKLCQFVCLIHEANAPSLAMAKKLGFRESLRSSFRGQPGVLMIRA